MERNFLQLIKKESDEGKESLKQDDDVSGGAAPAGTIIKGLSVIISATLM